jgi:putative restriction endonuclease
LIAVSIVGKRWIEFVRARSLREVNFWTPTPWNVRALNPGDKLYFLLKAADSKVAGSEDRRRKVAGYGHYSYYENLTIREAWQRFGVGNGVDDIEEFCAVRNHFPFPKARDAGPTEDSVIGCIVLDEVVSWAEQDYLVLEDYGLSFPRQIVRIKYFGDHVSVKIKLHNRAGIALDELPSGARRKVLKALDALEDVSADRPNVTGVRPLSAGLSANSTLFIFDAPEDLGVIFRFVGGGRKDQKIILDIAPRERLGRR